MLSLDSTTLAQYAAASTYDAKAQAVLSALPDVVEVKVYNSGGLVGSGTMSTPWATIAGPVITVGSIASFIVRTTGTPDPASWYLRFESGTKWLRGTFGLTGSGADFTWSRPIWKAGQRGRIASVSITTPRFDVRTAAFALTEGADTAALAATAPVSNVWDTIPNQSLTVGTPFTLNLADYDPPNTAAYSVNAGGDDLPDGLTLDEETGVISGTPTTAQTKNVAFDASTMTPVTLTLTGGGTDKAWTFGHPFKQGDIPDGWYITATGPSSFQADVRNYWSDGSVKYAVLSGIGGTSAVLSGTATAPSGSNVAEPSTTATVEFSSPATTVSLATARTAGSMSWDKDEPHKVREILGPVMSEFHYYSPVSGDNHLCVWWYVRAYSNGTVEVETVIENGWTKVASATEKAYTATITVNGTQRFNSAVAHRHHSRWSRRDWAGTAPGVTPVHNRAYLVSTKLVPSFAAITVSESTLNGLAQTATPMSRHDFDQVGAGGGYHAFLGLLPLWDSAYVISGDVRAYNGVLANEQASNCCGMGPGTAGFVNRDETTGLPAAHSDYLGESYSNRHSTSNGGTIVVGSDTTARPWTTDPAHSWAAGYLPYLITGRWFSLETAQFGTICEFLAWGVSSTEGYPTTRYRFRYGEDRGAAWQMRQMACVLAITPDDHPSRSKYLTHLELCAGNWYTNEVGINNLGIRQNIFNNTDYASAPYNSAGMFQQYFISQAFAFAWEIAGDQLGATAQTQLSASVTFHNSLPVGLLGTRPDGFCFRRAAAYGYAVGPDRTKPLTAGDFYSTFDEWYEALVSIGQIPTETCTTGADLLGGNIPDATSYWGNFLPAAAYAANTGTAGASAAYARMTGASNWGTFYANLTSAPQWAVVPR